MIHNALVSGKKAGQNSLVRIGYARVSTDEQNLDLQLRALEADGCELIERDHGFSGADVNRPGLAAALARVGSGDVLVVWKLDRLGRSLVHLIAILDGIGKAGAGFVSLSESVDTTTAGGRLVFHVMGAMAEFERSLIRDRTRAGMRAAMLRGKPVGRPRKLSAHQLAHARKLLSSGEETRAGAAALLGVDVIPDALLAHLAPLGWQHINLTGDYLWGADAAVGPEGFRPLHIGTTARPTLATAA